MNVFIQYDNPEIDPLNNKYFKLKVYIATNPDTWAAEEVTDGSVKLVQCPEEEIWKYFKTNTKWYVNKLVCFDNPSDITLHSDWWTGEKYRSIVIAFEKCKNTTSIACASEEET